jgi:hypothetical protein
MKDTNKSFEVIELETIQKVGVWLKIQSGNIQLQPLF